MNLSEPVHFTILTIHLISKLVANGCPSKMLTPGQVLSSYILKPLRKDLASIMSFIFRLLIFGGQNLHGYVQTLMPNLCMTSKRWQDNEWRPEARWPPNIFWISIQNARCMQNLRSFHPLGAILGLPSHIKRISAVPLYYICYKPGTASLNSRSEVYGCCRHKLPWTFWTKA